MTVNFPTLIGRFIHQCGALELLINNSIRAYATDSLLSTNAIKSPLYKRIVLLRQLLHERSDIKEDDIDSLCDELDEMRKNRNIVAHNPIVSTTRDGSGTEDILVLRYKPAGVTTDTISMENIAKLVEQSGQLMVRFSKLIPDATSA